MKTHALKYIFILLVTIGLNACKKSSTTIQFIQTTVNYNTAPTGVKNPVHFGWQMKSDVFNQHQTAYHILVADNLNSLKNNIGNVWDSKKTYSDESVNIEVEHLPLTPGTKYYWKVQVWDKDSIASDWSQPASFITALFSDESWGDAEWISYESMPDSLELVPGIPVWGYDTKGKATRRAINPWFRKTFKTDKKINNAYLFISGLGQYQAFINGKAVSNDFMSPGWTNYHKTVLYNTYDVTDEIIKGENAIGVLVGTGYYNINNERYRKLLITYGMPKLIAKLQINYSDGSTQTVITNDSWKSTASPLLYSSIFGGEIYDARLEQKGWNTIDFDDSSWESAMIAKAPGGILEPEITYPIQVAETFSPIAQQLEGADTMNFDFGQNASGIIEISLHGKKGDTVRVFPAELLKESIRESQRFTGGPHYYEYILNGDETETFQSKFTYYGLRYAYVTGASTKQYNNNSSPIIKDIKYHHTTNSAPRMGSFWCSNPLFNQIDTLIRYAISSNFYSVLTDCPHRERLGWIEQTHLMGNSVKFNFDLYHIYQKLVQDMMDSQHEDGLIPNIAPEYIFFGGAFTDSPEWGSAIILAPWLVYQWYGDLSIIEKAWGSMQRYLAYLDSKAENNILSHGLGDWYDLGPELPGFPQLSPIETTASAFYFLDYKVMADMAALLGKPNEEQKYRSKAQEIKQAYNKLLYHKDKHIYATGSQSSLAIPLAMGIVPDSEKTQVFNNLIDSITANDQRITTGDIGFHFLIEALTDGNQSQLVYDMNNRNDVPGYGYQIKQGATALAESWEALPVKSNNHFMLGHIMEWFYTGLGGIGQAKNSVAYKNLEIKPSFINGLEEVKTSYQTPYGEVISEWKQNSDQKELRIAIPVNTTGTIYLPALNEEDIIINNSPINSLNISYMKDTKNNSISIDLGSGIYNIQIKNQ